MNDDKSKRINLSCTPAQLHLITEALDGHAYWQLSDPKDRLCGHIFGESAKKPEVVETVALQERLEMLLPQEGHTEFHVRWDIEVMAANPEQAARRAREMQSPGTSALFFTVSDPDKHESFDVELPAEEGLEGLTPLLRLAALTLGRLNDDPSDIGEFDVTDLIVCLVALTDHLENIQGKPAAVKQKLDAPAPAP